MEKFSQKHVENSQVVRVLANDSFLQDMLLGMFVCFFCFFFWGGGVFLGFCFCLFVCLFRFFFLYVIIAVQRIFLAQQALHVYNISSCPPMTVNSLTSSFQGQGHVMIKVGCQ
jgi:hypothetical protein